MITVVPEKDGEKEKFKFIADTEATETLKLANQITTFMFEQERGEMKFFTEKQRAKLKDCFNELIKVVSSQEEKK